MKDRDAIQFLIEVKLYEDIRGIKELYNGKRAKDLINHVKENFKKAILKKYPDFDETEIDQLVESTLEKTKKQTKENNYKYEEER